MTNTINWVFYIEADTVKDRDRVIKEIEKKIALQFEKVDAERYWKAPSQFRVMASTTHSDKTFAELVLVAIQNASLIAKSIYINYGDDTFNATSCKSSIPGLETIFVEVING